MTILPLTDPTYPTLVHSTLNFQVLKCKSVKHWIEMFSTASKLCKSNNKLHNTLKHFTQRLVPYNTISSSPNPTASSHTDNERAPQSLYLLMSRNGHTSFSMVPILDQWVQQGHHLSYPELTFLVSRFRSFKRLSHALQISEWMSEKFTSNLSMRDRAHQMELISAVRGLGQAEKYFRDLPPTMRSPRICSTLLNCYAETRNLKKAEILMEKMKRSGFADSKYPYNIMLKLYFELEFYVKVDKLLEEMEKKGFFSDSWTYRIQLSAYSRCGKAKEMNMVVREMEADPMHTMTASDYVTAASGYLNAGFVEKSLAMLRLAERLAGGKTRKNTFECLITLYARAKLKEEVMRLWDIYESSRGVYNKGYQIMVSSLVILDDFENAEKMIDEWVESVSSKGPLDIRVINPLVQAYGKKGDFEKAEELINRISEMCNIERKRSILFSLADSYFIHNRMEDAVKTLKKALHINDSRGTPPKNLIMTCLNYLKTKGDFDELLEFTSLLEKKGCSAENMLCVDSVSQSVFDDPAELNDIELVRCASYK